MLRNGSRKPYLYFFRYILFLSLFAILSLFCIQASEAQRTIPFSNNKPFSTRDHKGDFSKSSIPDLNESQVTAIENLRQIYIEKALPLKQELMSFRVELRHLMRNKNVQPKTLIDLQKRISELQARLDRLLISYQIGVRALLTKEQIEQLSSDCSIGGEVYK
jgi:hypothetical protein